MVCRAFSRMVFTFCLLFIRFSEFAHNDWATHQEVKSGQKLPSCPLTGQPEYRSTNRNSAYALSARVVNRTVIGLPVRSLNTDCAWPKKRLTLQVKKQAQLMKLFKTVAQRKKLPEVDVVATFVFALKP